MPTPEDDLLYRMLGWPGGINNRIRETDTGQVAGEAGGFLRDAFNIDFSVEGTPRRRDGYSRVLEGMCHSLWRHPALPYALMVREGRLVLLAGAEPAVTDLGAIHPLRTVSYACLNDVVYFSNTEECGRVVLPGERLPWGLDVPAPTVREIGGRGLHPGCYQVAATYVDVDGVEHGASEPVQVNVQEGAGLEVVMAEAFPARAAYAQVFVTEANSELLYAAAQMYAPGAIALGAAEIGRGRVVETLFREKPFPAQLVRAFSGRLYTAVGPALFFTDPLRYELISPAQNVIMFPSPITLVEPAHDGLYVGYGSAVDFLAGTSPFDMQRRLVAAHTVVPGTGTQIEGRHVGVELDFLPVWWAQGVGFALGGPGGKVELLTDDRLATQKYESGAIISREREGAIQLVSALRMPSGGAAAASDSVVAEVRRLNG